MASLLIATILLGALGLYLAMPGGRAQVARGGLVLLAAAGGALLAVIADIAGRGNPLVFFGGCSVVGLFAAVRVITHKKPVYSALYFVLLVVAVTALLVHMQAYFLAAALIIVYAGAILVTYVFVIMLAQQQHAATYDTRAREPLLGCLAGFALLTFMASQLELFGGVDNMSPLPIDKPEAIGGIVAVGVPLLTDYVIAVQMIGLLLLAAMVGAIAIARRKPADLAEGEGD